MWVNRFFAVSFFLFAIAGSAQTPSQASLEAIIRRLDAAEAVRNGTIDYSSFTREINTMLFHGNTVPERARWRGPSRQVVRIEIRSAP